MKITKYIGALAFVAMLAACRADALNCAALQKF